MNPYRAPNVSVIKNISATRKRAFETGARGISIKRHASSSPRLAFLVARYEAGIYDGSKQEAARSRNRSQTVCVDIVYEAHLSRGTTVVSRNVRSVSRYTRH